MGWFRNYASSTIGMKQLMAVTGLGLALFVLVHMLGNLQVFIGRDQLNAYAQGLKDLGPLLWIARGGLLVIFLVHVFAAFRLISLNNAARPQKYAAGLKTQRTSFYRTSMKYTGFLLLAFVIYHLLHFTFGVAGTEGYDKVDELGRHDVYSMVVLGFQSPVVSGIYIAVMAFLCMHLAHGVSSWIQTLGLNHPKYNGLFKKAGPAYGWLLFLGNISMPIAILAGVVKL